MIDFMKISTRSTKRGVIELYPKFIIGKSSDLMIRGGDFYAIFLEDSNRWSTDEQDAINLIDHELDTYYAEHKKDFDANVKVLHMWDAETKMIDIWHHFVQKQQRDNFTTLDETVVFKNHQLSKRDYASFQLDYPLEEGEFPAYEKLISTLYSPEERLKIEWSIGAIITGDSKWIQKFIVFYGSAGSGKSTILNIIQKLFKGYYSVFDAKALGSANSAFALEPFKDNPLIAIQHDGDLSKIEDNTRLNSLVSHETMTVNEKFKSVYANTFKCFLYMGTNKPVKITDAKSGLIRRLIDVSPSGEKVPVREYNKLVKQIDFELPYIAFHCRNVYLENQSLYDDYIPINMIGASNDFYNFISDEFFVFKKENDTTLKIAWEMYKTYCENAKVPFPFSMRTFKEELKNYFESYYDRYTLDDGTRVRNYYSGFLVNKFTEELSSDLEKKSYSIFDMPDAYSILDDLYKDCPAQLASDSGVPFNKWEKVTTTLSDIDTTKTHYVKIPENHIVIDFDLKVDGKKSLEKNKLAASTWPETYAELSNGGNGIHLHYIYDGDPSELSNIFEENIEIKTFSGNSSLRRRVSLCNNKPIATISCGLPKKEVKNMQNVEAIKSEKSLREQIKRNLRKEIHPATKPSIDFIKKILDDAYDSGLKYDITDLRPSIIAFAANSTNQANVCLKIVNDMKFQSEENSTPDNVEEEFDKIVFFDVEVFPNLFLCNWKIQGPQHEVQRMINPSPKDMEQLTKFKLVGFNCRRYDNHIIYARMMGYTEEQLYNLSQRIIGKSPNSFFGEAYNLSYTDVYDFSSAGNKKSLKKWEIELGINHKELGLPWDKPVPKELWEKVAEYCDNDVLATEVVFDHLSADWTARQILADLADGSVNDTTNTLTTKIIFKENKKPQSQFNWRDLSQPVFELDSETTEFLKESCPVMMSKKHGPENSILPYFPGYKHEFGKSTYRGVVVGEGGYAKGVPDIYGDVALLDITSQHPHSAIAEVIFGVTFTRRFKEIVDGRVNIKHEAWEIVNTMLDGKLTKYIVLVSNGSMTAGQLADALKTAINSVYGLTSASFANPFKDPRNIDNIVAKRGALFMLDLEAAIHEQGFKVCHIKTDSIKIPDATPGIIQFVMDFGQDYGYNFEHEATYDKMCLVNDAVYIAKYASAKKCKELYGYIPEKNMKKENTWTATGTQFAVPYVFKTLFSHEELKFEDFCETKSVTGSIFLDFNEKLVDVSKEEKELSMLTKRYKDSQIPLNDIGRMNELKKIIETGHNYQFVGKIGEFCPIIPDGGGGLLVREVVSKDGSVKYDSVVGAKDYRWMESQVVKTVPEFLNRIDKSYYVKLADKARSAIDQYGDFTWFVSNDDYDKFENGILPF